VHQVKIKEKILSQMPTTLSNISEAPGRSNVPECTYKTKNNTMVLLAREKSDAHFRMYLQTRRATRGEAFGAFAPLKISKHYLATLTIAKILKIKMKFCILIIFSKVLLEFFFLILVNYLFTSLI